ncbi:MULTISPECIES: acyltransferase [unclassified Rhodococcus (in: high G+C Gram-positive bacteria)]|uniref:acyltransferase family protein n=1 Tax=unclassified Rhodococcus (in: high G+C Gram-positive bacteria) TaxID=192944 RepID=UPI00207B8ED5|nr:acyltransferase [Rhodococcus sp. 14-2483-1-2]
MNGDRPSQSTVDESASIQRVDAPRVQMDGADLLRVIAVLAVLYSHISFYLLDDIGGGWWMIDVVNTVLIEDAGLNLHLSFVGVSIFMLLTGLLITRSAMRQSRRDFMVARLARLVPALWFAIAMAVILVKLGLNGMFSGQPGITNGEAVLSFFLGGFFLRPEVAVLGVTWTLVVQIVFYLYCISMRGTLNTRPIVVPLVGAALCALVIVYNLYLPQPYTVPFLTKVAGVLPTLFLGQIAYLGWARLITWRWVVVGVIAQIEVIRLAIEVHTFWMGDTYLWTLLVVTGTVLILARYNGPITRWPVIRWIGTRSYAIYLIHTLVLYRIYATVEPHLGPSAAVLAFLAGTAALAEIMYRWIELPAARHISAQYARLRARSAT